ncbi:MAG: RNA-binding cell elongation regulator Jag/EloR [Armatimonadota bacterium]|nr:RNA-binding cell elongation regulator Jag/EloR [Armatimonadota bacterium]
MSAVEGTGRTVEEAVESALRVLGVGPDQVDVEVLEEPRPAILGFGGRGARVRVTPRASPAEAAREFALTVLALMGYSASVRVNEGPDTLTVEVDSRPAGILIGRRGRTLDALELLLAVYLQRRYGQKTSVLVDTAGYRKRREAVLVAEAHRAATTALREKRPVPLEPMDPRERRTVHLALRGHPGVTTISEGEEELRHVVVVPMVGKSAGQTTGLEGPGSTDET